MCVQYIGGCSVHRGDTISTSGGYHQYIGGIPWVHRRDIMSISEVFSTSEGYHEYIGGIPWVHRRDTMSTSGGYHEYIGGCSVHRGISWYMWGDTMSKSGDVQYIGGIPWVHRGDIMSTSGDVQYIGVFNRNWKDFIKLLPHMYHDIPPMYWTSPDVLMISPRCTHVILPMYWTSPNVFMISPRCTHDIPPMYWTPSDVLNIPRCTEHTLYRVLVFVRTSFHSVCTLKFLSEYFAVWTSQLVNTSILFNRETDQEESKVNRSPIS